MIIEKFFNRVINLKVFELCLFTHLIAFLAAQFIKSESYFFREYQSISLSDSDYIEIF